MKSAAIDSLTEIKYCPQCRNSLILDRITSPAVNFSDAGNFFRRHKITLLVMRGIGRKSAI